MTISARGITYFLDDDATFLTIEEWEHDAKLY
jgi:dynein heavy chain